MNVRFTKNAIIFAAIIAFRATVVFGQAYQDYSNATVKNDTGKPMSLIAIRAGGEEIGDLYITGKEARFNEKQKIVKGSGYIQAREGRYIAIVGEYKFTQPGKAEVGYTQFLLRVRRIDWDEDGRTTQVLGVKPALETMGHPDLKVKSNLETPTVTKDGILELEVEEMGKISIRIRFGYKATLAGDPVVISVDLPAEIQEIAKKKFAEDDAPPSTDKNTRGKKQS